MTLLLTFLGWTLLNFRFVCLFRINFLWTFITFKIFDIFLRLILFIFSIRFWILFYWNFLSLLWILFLILTNNRLWFSWFLRLFFSVLIMFRIFNVLYLFLMFNLIFLILRNLFGLFFDRFFYIFILDLFSLFGIFWIGCWLFFLWLLIIFLFRF